MDRREVWALASAFIVATIAFGVALALTLGSVWLMARIDPAPAPSARLYISEGCK